MVVLRPGDRVLLALIEEPAESDARDYAQALHDAFPGVEFVIAGGVSGMAVHSPVPITADWPESTA